MNAESTKQRLHRIAKPIVEEFGVNDFWDIIGDQRSADWHLKIWSEPVVQFAVNDDASDEAIATQVRSELAAHLGGNPPQG